MEFKDNWICKPCKDKIVPRYNPFDGWSGTETEKHYDADCGSDTIHISNILNNCKSESIKSLNVLFTSLSQTSEHPRDKVSELVSSFFLNIDGNTTNFDQLQVLLSRISHSFSAIGLAETNKGPENCTSFTLPNYKAFYQETRESKLKGTGVALYIHNSLNVSPVDEISECSMDIESLILKTTNTQSPIYFGVVYRPNDGDRNVFYEKLQHIFNSLPKKGVYIMGDFNINLLSSIPDNSYEECIYSSGYSPLISIPTHSRSSCKDSCIDNILTNDSKNVLHSGTLSDNIMHHLPTFCISNHKVNSITKETITQNYDYNKANMRNFYADIESKATSNDFTKGTFTDFSQEFNRLLDKNFKLSKPKVTKRSPQSNPWITEGIINACERKHELKTVWVKSITKLCPEGNRHHHEKFRSYRRALNTIIKKAKAKHFHNALTDCKEDRRKTWKILNELRGNSKSTMKPPFIINNERITERRVIANEFNKYFSSIASNLNSTLPDVPNIADHKFPSFIEYLGKSNEKSIALFPCDTVEISSLIMELVNGKSSDIPVRIIKHVSDLIAPVLMRHFNNLMERGEFPDVSKLGRITPIYKKIIQNFLKTTDQSPPFQFLANYLKRLSTLDFIASSHLKNYCMINSLASENHTPPVTQLTTQ